MRISDWTSDVCSSDLLAEVTGKLSEARERLTAAADVLRRVLVSAPVTGTVVQLKVHTIGGVIGAGDPILDIVPRDDDLVIDARSAPPDTHVVSHAQTAQRARAALQQRNRPRTAGQVPTISP